MSSEHLINNWQNREKGTLAHFKKVVKKLTDKKNKQIDVLADTVHNQVFKEIDCLDCANCCTSIPPMVIKSDIKRISKHLGIKEKEFEAQYLRLDDDQDWVMKTSPCVFLGGDNKCEIYDHRPKACRQYPHTDDRSFKRNAKLHAQNAVYCPAVFHILDRLSKIG